MSTFVEVDTMVLRISSNRKLTSPRAYQIATALGHAGCSLILHSRSKEHSLHLAARLREQGLVVHQVAAELSDAAAVMGLAKEVEQLCGILDILHNNAAIMAPYHDDWLTARPDDYEQSFRVNTIAPILLCNYFLPQMLAQKWGRIVNVTSGIKDQPELMAYAASKAALDKHVFDTAVKLE